MTSSEPYRELLIGLGVEVLEVNRYEPAVLGRRDVRRTPYYRRNRKEFDELARRYGPMLSGGAAGGRRSGGGGSAVSGGNTDRADAAETPRTEPPSAGSASREAPPSGRIPSEGTSAPTERLPRLDVRRLGGALGYGLFTLDALSPGDLIGEYTGIVRPARRGRVLAAGGFSSDYAWDFPKVRLLGRRLELDARCAGGPLRFANHAEDPSAQPDHFPLEGRWRVVFVARRTIPAGGEITVNYGEAYWSGGMRELDLGSLESPDYS